MMLRCIIISIMRTFVVILVGIGLLLNSTIATSSDDTIPYYMFNASSLFQVDVALLQAFCKVESNCKQSAINHNDGNKLQKAQGKIIKSHGLFQIQLQTARGLGFKGSLKQLRNPETNTYYAAKYIRHLFDKYTDPVKVIAGYNAGEATLDHWISLKKHRYPNNRYVDLVMKAYIRFKVQHQ